MVLYMRGVFYSRNFATAVKGAYFRRNVFFEGGGGGGEGLIYVFYSVQMYSLSKC